MRRGASLIDKSESWADRGWYLAVEYGVLARDRFLSRLPKLRGLGTFKELLEPGGKILYRNLFREDAVKDAWELLTLLRPWCDNLVCYLNGEELPLKDAQDVLWCSAFLAQERPCRGPKGKKTRPAGCENARVLLGPGQWRLAEPRQRHALTFSHVDESGTLRFDRDALGAFASSAERARRCPVSPARDPSAFAAAFEEIPVRSLGWPLVAEMGPALRKRLGAKHLEAEHGFVLKSGEELEPHEAIDLCILRGKVAVRRAGSRTAPVSTDARVPAVFEKLLEEGTPLRGVRMQEAYARRKGGHYDLEQRFVLSTRITLLPSDRPAQFSDYELTTHPRSTPEYAAWAERVAEALP